MSLGPSETFSVAVTERCGVQRSTTKYRLTTWEEARLRDHGYLRARR